MVELVEDVDQLSILRDLLDEFVQRFSALISFSVFYLEITLQDKRQIQAGLDGFQIQQAVGLYFMHFQKGAEHSRVVIDEVLGHGAGLDEGEDAFGAEGVPQPAVDHAQDEVLRL